MTEENEVNVEECTGTESEDNTNEGGIDPLIFTLGVIVLMAVTMFANRYYAEAQWLITTLGILTLLLAALLFIVAGWKVVAGYFVVMMITMNLLPTPDKLFKQWQARIDNPEIGDYYLFNTDIMYDADPKDENIYELSFYKLKSFDDKDLVFTIAEHNYSHDGADNVLKDGKIKEIEMSSKSTSIERAEIATLLEKRTLGGVYRPE